MKTLLLDKMKQITIAIALLLGLNTSAQIVKVDTFLLSEELETFIDLDFDGNSDLSLKYNIPNNSNSATYHSLLLSNGGEFRGQYIYGWFVCPGVVNENTFNQVPQNPAYTVFSNDYTNTINTNYFVGENKIPFRLLTSTGYKYGVLKVNQANDVAIAHITGWYINQTVDGLIYCDDATNDSIIATYSDTYSTDTQSACDYYDWIDGNTYTASTNAPTWTIPNVVGFDSTITLDLTIGNSYNMVEEVEACGSYSMLGNVYTEDIQITESLQSIYGCDSTIINQIVILPEPEVIVEDGIVSVCIGDDIPFVVSGDALFYTWNTDDIVATELGITTYEVTGTSANFCTTTEELTIYVTDCSSAAIGELNNTPKQLIKIVDVLGRETPFKPNTPLLYIYNDGTVERKVVLK